jgi:ankyrin repeat protein
MKLTAPEVLRRYKDEELPEAAVNATGEFDNTPLHQAVQQGHGAIVKFLLEHGASTDAKNALGQTPIDVATLARRYEIVRILQSPTSGHA